MEQSGSNSPKRQQTIGEYIADRVLVALLLLVFVALAVPSFLEAHVRAKVARVLVDMRSLATTLQDYYTDHGFYPAASTGTASIHGACFDHPDMHRLPTFRLDPGLRDPFIVKEDGWEPFYYPSDACSPVKGARFIYWTTGEGKDAGWMASSAGPDGDYDIDPRDVYDPSTKRAPPAVLLLTYDPTNGSLSDGDIWRTKTYVRPQ